MEAAVKDFLFRAKRKILRGRFSLSGVSVSNPELLDPSAQLIESSISGRVLVGKNSIIKNSSILVKEASIGRNTSLWGPGISINAMLNPVAIGSFCSIAKNVSIQEYNHRVDRLSSYFAGCNVFSLGMEVDIVSKGGICIGNDVWLATNVVVGSGVRIGDGAVIGANSVVLDDIPPYAIAVGSPARVVRYRFAQEVIDALLAIKWWNWSDEKILANKGLFLQPLTIKLLEGEISA